MALVKLCTFLAFVALAATLPTDPKTEGNEMSLEENIAKYIENQHVSFELPIFGSTVTLGARNLNEDEIDLKVQLTQDNQARKSKLKKIFAPLLILVILKAITLIPLALGILGLKTWNAIQLSFVTFVISIALGVYELCKKIATDHPHPIVTHTPWHSARSADNIGQDLAYTAYLS